MINKRTIAWIAAVAVTAGLLAYLLAGWDRRVLADMFRSLHPGYLIAAFGAHMLVYALRTKRYLYAIPETGLSFPAMYALHTVHNFYNQLLPGGTGELSFPLLLKKFTGKSVSEGVAIVFFIRLWDVLAQLLILSVALMAFGSTGLVRLGGLDIRLILIPVLAVCAVIIATIPIMRIKGEAILAHVPGKGRISIMVYAMGQAVLRIVQEKILLRISALTLFSNLTVILVFWLILNGLGLTLGFGGTAIAATVLLPVYLLPVKGIAGFGTTEGGWVLSLWFVGIPKATGITAGLAIHVLTLGFVMVLAAAGIIFLIRRRAQYGPVG